MFCEIQLRKRSLFECDIMEKPVCSFYIKTEENKIHL